MDNSSNPRRWLINGLKAVLAVLVIYFATSQLVTSWETVVNYPWQLSPAWLGISVLLHLLAFVVFAQAWCYVVEGFGYTVKSRHAFKLAYIAGLGRYLPGRVWTIFGMAYMARRVHVPEQVALASYMIAVVFSLPTSFILSAVAVFLHPEILTAARTIMSAQSLLVGVIASVGLSLLMLFFPQRVLYLANILLRLLKRPPLEYRVTLKVAIKVYTAYFIAWIIFGFAFWTFLHGLLAQDQVPLSVAAGAYVFAYQIGYLAIFSPGGLGVRELTLSIFLTPFIGPVAAGISVAARVWNIVVELIAAAFAFSIKLPSENSNLQDK